MCREGRWVALGSRWLRDRGCHSLVWVIARARNARAVRFGERVFETSRAERLVRVCRTNHAITLHLGNSYTFSRRARRTTAVGGRRTLRHSARSSPPRSISCRRICPTAGPLFCSYLIVLFYGASLPPRLARSTSRPTNALSLSRAQLDFYGFVRWRHLLFRAVEDRFCRCRHHGCC